MKALSWGSGATGVLLDGSLEDRISPVACSMLPSASEQIFLAPGGSHLLSVCRDKNGETQYLTIGGNEFGQLGDPDFSLEQGGPLDISRFFPSAFIHAASGWNHTLVLLADGSLYAWGENSHGQCGFDPSSAKFIKQPMRLSNSLIAETDRIVAVACGMRHSAFVTSSGAVYCFGEGKFGQLGNGSEKSTHLPSKVVLPHACHVMSASLGSRHSVFLMRDGSVFTCGCNRFGQCGSPSTTAKVLSPMMLPTFSGTTLVGAGWNFTLLVQHGPKLVSFGRNNYGQLGRGLISPHSVDLQSIDLSDVLDGDIRQIACGSEHSVFLSEKGSVFAFGWNEHGQLGLGDTVSRSSPSKLPLDYIDSIASGGGFSIALYKVFS